MPSSSELHCGAKQLRVVLNCAVGAHHLLYKQETTVWSADSRRKVFVMSSESGVISCGYSVQLLIIIA